MIDLFKELASKTTGMEYLETYLRYIISATDKITETDINDIIIKTLPQGGDTIMPTLAEKWIKEGIERGRQEGIQEGIQKGKVEGKKEGILKGILEAIQFGLELKFGTKGLSLYPDISKIDDIVQLRSIKDAIIIAKDIDEIKDMINK